MIENILIGVILGFAIGILAYLLGWADQWGAITGGFICFFVYVCTEIQGFILLLIFLALGSLMTRWGYQRKHSLGVAEGKKGRRGAAHAVANCLVGCIFALLYLLSDQSYLFAVGFTGAFATALGDTASSELGPLYGRATRSAITWNPVSPGTKGGISLEGTLLGVLGSLLVAGFALPLQFIPAWGIPFIVAATSLGNLSESVIWSLTTNPRKWVHHGLNLFNTAVGGIVSIIFVSFFSRFFE